MARRVPTSRSQWTAPAQPAMLPSAHLLTSTAFASGLYAASGSLPLAGAALAGGTLIDLDHYFDYVAFHGRRHPGPRAFLRFYGTHQYRRIVLLLHSWELLIPAGLLLPLSTSPLPLALWLGCMLHMTLDLAFNSPRIRRPFAFYSLLWRSLMNFEKDRLLYPDVSPAAAPNPDD